MLYGFNGLNNGHFSPYNSAYDPLQGRVLLPFVPSPYENIDPRSREYRLRSVQEAFQRLNECDYNRGLSSQLSRNMCPYLVAGYPQCNTPFNCQYVHNHVLLQALEIERAIDELPGLVALRKDMGKQPLETGSMFSQPVFNFQSTAENERANKLDQQQVLVEFKLFLEKEQSPSTPSPMERTFSYP